MLCCVEALGEVLAVGGADVLSPSCGTISTTVETSEVGAVWCRGTIGLFGVLGPTIRLDLTPTPDVGVDGLIEVGNPTL